MSVYERLVQKLQRRGIDPADHEGILNMVFLVEEHGMEQGAYSVTVEQYAEVAGDIILGLDAGTGADDGETERSWPIGRGPYSAGTRDS